MTLQQLTVWIFTGGWLYFSIPPFYRLLFTWTGRWLERSDLSVWNGGEWVSLLCAVCATGLYVAGVCTVVEISLAGDADRRSQWLRRVGTIIVLPAAGWWITRILLRLIVGNSPAGLSTVIATFVFLLLGGMLLAPGPLRPYWVLRGSPQRTSREIRRQFRRLLKRGLMPWGAAVVEKRNEPLHFFIIGNTGAGKSTWLEVMMAHTLVWMGIRPAYRAIVVDAKGNILPFLEALGLTVEGDAPLCIILNPLDRRAARWAIGKDVNTPGKAYETACAIIPETEGDNQFFTQAGRSLVTAVLVSLQRAKGEGWTLRDLLNAFSTPAAAHTVIRGWHPRPEAFDDNFKGKKGERNDIFMTVRSALDQYQLIAALWEHATREFSIADWERGEYVLVLGSDYEYQEVIRRINGLLFTFIAARLKQLPDEPERRVWLYVDELIATGKLVAFEQLLQLGRSKSVCMVSSVLNIASFVEEFGENVAKSIWALSRHRALFPMDGESAKFVSEAIGKYELIEATYTPRVPVPGEPPRDSGLTYRRGERATILPQELDDQNLPQPGPLNGLTGFFSLPGGGVHRHTFSWEEIERMRPRPIEEVEGYERIDERYVSTIPSLWSAEELAQLRLDTPNEVTGWGIPRGKGGGPKKPMPGNPPRPVRKRPPNQPRR